MCFSLSDFKDIFTIVGVIVSTALFFLAYRQYGKAEKQKKAEHFFKLREKYNTNKDFRKIREIIDCNDTENKEISLDAKREFFGFYEEIAIMVNSKLIKEELAFYMFGYYAIKYDEIDDFKSYIDEEKEYWIIFSDFAQKMINNEKLVKENQFDYNKILL